jgi:hypothetical protein
MEILSWSNKRTTCTEKQFSWQLGVTHAYQRAHSLSVLRDGVTLHIWYLRAIYRNECSRSVVRGEPDEVVERLRPGRRECLGRALEHTVVYRRYLRVRGGERERGKKGKEEGATTQHVS